MAKKKLFVPSNKKNEEGNEILLLQFMDDKSFKIAETVLDECKVEFIFLTEQMNREKGFKLFQKKGEEMITKELQQIHDMEGFQPKHWDELSKKERTKALHYLRYLEEKRDGSVKG